VIRGLAEGSAAAQAGLRDGDVITEVNEIEKVRNNDALPLELTVRRGDQSLRISYLPRGAPVDAYRWVRNSGAPDAACRF
jgi:C-terminal processing protease CtpA/Prc